MTTLNQPEFPREIELLGVEKLEEEIRNLAQRKAVNILLSYRRQQIREMMGKTYDVGKQTKDLPVNRVS